MKIKHEKIAQDQEIRQLKQHIAYLDRMNAEKDKATLENHNELQSTKFELNQHLKTIKNFEDQINKNKSGFLDKDRMIL